MYIKQIYFISLSRLYSINAIYPVLRFFQRKRVTRSPSERLLFVMWEKIFHQKIWPVRDKLFRFAWSLLGSQAEAEDVVQETFLRVLSQGDAVEAPSNPEAWCMAVAKNLSYDQLRKRQRQSQPLSDKVGELLENVDSALTPDQRLVSNDGIGQVQRLMEQLPATQKAIMQLRDIEGYSYQEIADILQIDIGQVKASLSRARKKVRKQIIQLEAHGSSTD